jgi:hypothetical protein
MGPDPSKAPSFYASTNDSIQSFLATLKFPLIGIVDAPNKV